MSDPALRPATLMLPPAPFLAAVAGGWWLEHEVFALPLDFGNATRPLAWSLIGAGLALLIWTLAVFVRRRTTVNPYAGASTLVTGGPFRFSRNPIYLGDFLLRGGAALWLASLWPLLFAPLLWALIRYTVIRHEEAHLEAKFGDAWRAYAARVRRWL